MFVASGVSNSMRAQNRALVRPFVPGKPFKNFCLLQDASEIPQRVHHNLKSYKAHYGAYNPDGHSQIQGRGLHVRFCEDPMRASGGQGRVSLVDRKTSRRIEMTQFARPTRAATDYDSTIIGALELSEKKWVLAVQLLGVKRHSRHVVEARTWAEGVGASATTRLLTTMDTSGRNATIPNAASGARRRIWNNS
jgi:hypothetical protein